MADTTAWTQGIKSPWQRISIMFALAVITALSSTVGIVYYQKNKAQELTIIYERSQKEQAQFELKECNTEKYDAAVRSVEQRERRLEIQDSAKKILKIK